MARAESEIGEGSGSGRKITTTRVVTPLCRVELDYCVEEFAMLRIVIAGICVGLTGCMDTADTFPLNSAAKQIGSPKVEFARTGVGSGPVTITMPDGEVLKGTYRVAFGAAEGFAFSGAQMATALVITDGPVQFVANGPKTQVLCRGTSSVAGHGSGQCQNADGAIWAVSR